MPMSPRWPGFYEPALEWIKEVEAAVVNLRSPERGTFLSVTNALEYQFEQGADPETVRHLLRALLAFARAAGHQPSDLGLPDHAEATLASLSPMGTR